MLFFLGLGASGNPSKEEIAVKALTKSGGYYVQGKPVTLIGIRGDFQLNTDPLQYLKDLPSLHTVLIRGTSLSDPNLMYFAGLKKLVKLHLDENEDIGDPGMVHLQGLTQLRNLSLSDTGVGDLGIEKLKKLTNLEELNLAGTRITDRGLVHLQRFMNLRVLDLAETKITAAGLKNIENLTNLEVLYLHRTEIDDEGMKYLRRLDKLRELWPSRGFGDQGLKTLALFNSIKSLNLLTPKSQIMACFIWHKWSTWNGWVCLEPKLLELG
jgi:Leucine-rich repeat (LRR) protein